MNYIFIYESFLTRIEAQEVFKIQLQIEWDKIWFSPYAANLSKLKKYAGLSKVKANNHILRGLLSSPVRYIFHLSYNLDVMYGLFPMDASPDRRRISNHEKNDICVLDQKVNVHSRKRKCRNKTL